MKGLLAWLASFRLRVLFRFAFLLLALAVLAMAITVLQEEKQRSYDNYQASIGKTKEQIVARLHHPSGQLAVLNPGWGKQSNPAGRPVVLPYSAIDFDDQNKVRTAVEMAGCLVQYRNSGSLLCKTRARPGSYIFPGFQRTYRRKSLSQNCHTKRQQLHYNQVFPGKSHHRKFLFDICLG